MVEKRRPPLIENQGALLNVHGVEAFEGLVMRILLEEGEKG
jgi:hypothetical protein